MIKVTNQNYCGQVVQIHKLIKLDNCDNVQHANIFGNLVIVSKAVEVGTIGIYFPVECELSKEFLSNNNLYRHEYLNKDKNEKGYFEDNGRIKAVKFRGNASNGFFIPLTSLAFTRVNTEKELTLGITFNEINDIPICKKYKVKRKEPKISNNNKTKKIKRTSKLIEDQFKFHYDTAQLWREIHRVKPSHVISITKKLHGTSAVVGNLLTKKKLNIFEKLLKLLHVNIKDKEYGMIYSSRRVVKNEYFEDDLNSSNHFYKEDVWKKHAEEMFTHLKKGMSIYFEIVGFTPSGEFIQKDYDYGCAQNESKPFVYRITQTNEDGYTMEYSAKQVQEFCEIIGVRPVPELYYGYAKNLFKDIPVNLDWNMNFLEALKVKYLEQDCCMCKNKVPDEGIVLRIDNIGEKALKLKSFLFLQKETKDLDKGVIDMEEEN